MLPERRRSRRVGRISHAVLALGVSAVLLVVLGFGLGTRPALGRALDPGHGAWTAAAGARRPASRTLRLPGLAHPVQVRFTAAGAASVSAASDSDLFLALGYLHARFRLTQLDLARRLGEGRLAQLRGPSAVASDTFELQWGLLRTARQEWAGMPKASPAARTLTAYARGVNDYLATARASGQWPSLFSLAGVYPAAWTPVDSLVVQGVLDQQLSFTTAPLDYALLQRSLGARHARAWFPVTAPGSQSPWDPGPYRNRGISPVPAGPAATTSSLPDPPAARTTAARQAGRAATPETTELSGSATTPAAGQDGVAQAAAAILGQVSALPAGQLHASPDGSAWAVSGARAAGTGAMLAGDPSAPQALPALWFQVALSAPGLTVSGASVPGMPAVLIGHNADIAWSVTGTPSQSVLYYAEQTSPSRPGEYFWRGRWRRMQREHDLIPVRGGTARRLTVNRTVHGPVLTRAGQTVSADWTGALGSPEVAVLLRIGQASDFRQFRAALAGWRSPAGTFVYADRHGNVGAISAGLFPQVRSGQPWLPMPGTGADDIAGVIPYRAVPQVYNPPGRVVVTAGQRPVSRSYPYYLGTSAGDSGAGFRAATEYRYLRRHSSLRPASLAALQGSLTDGLARQVVPRLLAALRQARLTPVQEQTRQVLAGWDYSMDTDSAGASVWWTFWSDYLSAVFGPWWKSAHVPVHLDPASLAVGPGQASLTDVLAYWTRHDGHNPAFSPPGGPARGAAGAMRAAFGAAVAHLSSGPGGAPDTWTWGKLHTGQFASVTGAGALGYGPRPDGGDPWTPDAADGGLTTSAGPSWRMIVHWNGPAAAGAGMYPGGQSENPASPWYDNLMADWQAGRYLPMPPARPAPAATGVPTAGRGGPGGSAPGGRVRWELTP